MPVEIYIGNLELNYDLEISETNPKAFLSKIYKYLYSYEPSKSIKEILEVLSKNRRKVRIFVPNLLELNSKTLKYIGYLSKNPNYSFLFEIDFNDLSKLKKSRFKSIIPYTKIYLESFELDTSICYRTFNIFPILISTLITFFVFRIFLVAKYFGYLDFAIALTFVYLIVLRLIVYNLK